MIALTVLCRPSKISKYCLGLISIGDRLSLVGWDAVSNLSYIAGATSAFRFAHPAGVLTNSTILYVNNRSQYSLTPF